MNLEVGMIVRAKRPIIEGVRAGEGEGDPELTFTDEKGRPQRGYIHAQKGDFGIVLHRDDGLREDDNPVFTARFWPKGTADMIEEEDVDNVGGPLRLNQALLEEASNLRCLHLQYLGLNKMEVRLALGTWQFKLPLQVAGGG